MFRPNDLWTSTSNFLFENLKINFSQLQTIFWDKSKVESVENTQIKAARTEHHGWKHGFESY